MGPFVCDRLPVSCDAITYTLAGFSNVIGIWTFCTSYKIDNIAACTVEYALWFVWFSAVRNIYLVVAKNGTEFTTWRTAWEGAVCLMLIHSTLNEDSSQVSWLSVGYNWWQFEYFADFRVTLQDRLQFS